GFGMDVRIDRPSDGAACSCQKAAATLSERVSVSERGVGGFQHTAEGAAAAAGAPSYGVRLEHSSGNGSDHRARLSLESRDGTFVYELKGGVVQRTTTEWGGLVYRYAGTYSNTGRPAMSHSMPDRGTYVVEVTISWRQSRIVHVTVDLTEG
ncbi:MAG TPA: hypothetical protein VM573_01995, partial [Actinomycetota bacterium]|nr:hypothetical protein [Actinomycetota bacterium]